MKGLGHKFSTCGCDWCINARGYLATMSGPRYPMLPAQEETSPKPEDKTKKNYRLIRTSGYWQLWLSLKSGDQKWLTDREVSGESGKTFAEAFYDADLKFIPGGVK